MVTRRAPRPRIIGLDWGSSTLRAMQLGPDGQVLELRSSKRGASGLAGEAEAFSAALDELVGDWRDADVPVWACGMVGSQHGWREVPYADCPADPGSLAAASLAADWHGHPVHILPGLRCHLPHGVLDIMRGEETQVVGALTLATPLTEAACIVMPGTHSKWTEVRDGRVHAFSTYMTGEMFALLRQHSVLSKLMSARAGSDLQACAAGMRAARDHGDLGLSHQLFSVRTLGLDKTLRPQALPDYLSGLLIGHELRAGLRWRQGLRLGGAPLALIGEEPLVRRYLLGLEIFDVAASLSLSNTAGAGLFRLATSL